MLYEHTLTDLRLYTDRQRLMHELPLLHTYIPVVSVTVLSLRCVGRCVSYTCWRTRFLCVRLSGSGCLTPPASLVWRQVRGGHISTVLSDLLHLVTLATCMALAIGNS